MREGGRGLLLSLVLAKYEVYEGAHVTCVCGFQVCMFAWCMVFSEQCAVVNTGGILWMGTAFFPSPLSTWAAALFCSCAAADCVLAYKWWVGGMWLCVHTVAGSVAGR